MRYCKHCSNPILFMYRRRYCSARCRWKAKYNRLYKRKSHVTNFYPINCTICQGPTYAKFRSRKKYCGRVCKGRASRLRELGLWEKTVPPRIRVYRCGSLQFYFKDPFLRESIIQEAARKNITVSTFVEGILANAARAHKDSYLTIPISPSLHDWMNILTRFHGLTKEGIENMVYDFLYNELGDRFKRRP